MPQRHADTTWNREIDQGKRFGFGANWARFLKNLSEAQIESAIEGLVACVGARDLSGKTFLDVGSGSGIHSLAAHRLGATVHSFDFDKDSVQCTKTLRERYGDETWTIEEGSVLDSDFMEGLGLFDIVYSWGVLHHTGDMWTAIAKTADRTKPGGLLTLALYNDQGGTSRRWKMIKKGYVSGSEITKAALVTGTGIYFEGKRAISRALRGKNPLPFEDWRKKRDDRGMQPWTDLIDWVGGYPFEVAKPEEVFEFMKGRGFALEHMSTCGGGHGCNEFTFQRL